MSHTAVVSHAMLVSLCNVRLPVMSFMVQMGTIVDNPLDFYGGRLSRTKRKATLTEQLLADSQLTTTRKKRYDKIQVRFMVHRNRCALLACCISAA